MAKPRKSRDMQEQVFHLYSNEKLSIRTIAKSLKIHRNTVREIIRNGPDAKEREPLPADWAKALDWERIKKEYYLGVTLKVLWQETAPEVTYKVFWHYFRGLVPASCEAVTMRLAHKAGEKIFFDFTDGISIVDRQTGEKTKTQLFSAVLPFSSFLAGEFVLDQKQPTLIQAIENAFYEIGGVTPYVTVDNLKSAVRKSHLYDPDVNQTFVEFANHWGFAVLPARPYHPKDKASVESIIGVTQRQFYNEVRDRTFYSLTELNEAYREYKKRLNTSPMKDHGDLSREERFASEKPLLKVIPKERFEISIWKTVKVHPDCHIQVERKFYSVPYHYIGQTLKVRIRTKLIEIYTEDSSSVAVHPRLFGSDRASTLEAHYPEEKLAVARFEVKSAQRAAQKIGPKTESLVDALVCCDYPLKYLRRIQGILRLQQSGLVKKESLEYASEQALRFNKKSFHYVKQAALFFEKGGAKPRVACPQRATSDLYLHQNQEEKT